MNELELLRARIVELESIVDGQAIRYQAMKDKHSRLHNYVHDCVMPCMDLTQQALDRNKPKVHAALHQCELVLEAGRKFNKYEGVPC